MSLGTVTLDASPFPTPPSLINYGTAYGPGSFGPRSSDARYSVPIAEVARAVGGISEAEHREIDAAAAEQADRAERVEQLSEYVGTIHPDTLLAAANRIAEGVFQGPPPPPPTIGPPVVFEAPPVAARPPSVAAAPRSVESDLRSVESGEEPMANLTDLWGALGNIGTAYVQARYTPQPQQAIFQQTAADYPGSVQDWLDGPLNVLAPDEPAQAVIPPAISGGLRTVGCISQRDIEIAARAGVTPETVDVVLAASRYGRRRRRSLVTKSDIRGIAAMKQVLGGGEAFKLWLAKNA